MAGQQMALSAPARHLLIRRFGKHFVSGQTAGGATTLKSICNMCLCQYEDSASSPEHWRVFCRCAGEKGSDALEQTLPQGTPPSPSPLFLCAAFTCLARLSRAGPPSASPGEEGCARSLSGGLDSCGRSPPAGERPAEGGGGAGGERRRRGARGVAHRGFLGSGDPC